MYELGPITKAWIESDHDFQAFRTHAGNFRMDIIQEYRYSSSNSIQRREEGRLVFTMRDYEFKDLVSIKQIYMNSVDEFDCAMKCFGSWDHWLYLCKRPDFLEGRALKAQWTGIKHWREEKRLMEQNAAKKIIIDLAAKGNFAAAKMLFDNTKLNGEVGRPNNEKVLQKVTEMAEHEYQVAQDMKRIRLAINNDKSKKNSHTA